MLNHNGKTEKDKFYACSPKSKNFEVVNPLSEKVKVKGKKIDVKVVEDPDGFTYLVYKNKKYNIDRI